MRAVLVISILLPTLLACSGQPAATKSLNLAPRKPSSSGAVNLPDPPSDRQPLGQFSGSGTFFDPDSVALIRDSYVKVPAAFTGGKVSRDYCIGFLIAPRIVIVRAECASPSQLPAAVAFLDGETAAVASLHTIPLASTRLKHSGGFTSSTAALLLLRKPSARGRRFMPILTQEACPQDALWQANNFWDVYSKNVNLLFTGTSVVRFGISWTDEGFSEDLGANCELSLLEKAEPDLTQTLFQPVISYDFASKRPLLYGFRNTPATAGNKDEEIHGIYTIARDYPWIKPFLDANH